MLNLRSDDAQGKQIIRSHSECFDQQDKNENQEQRQNRTLRKIMAKLVLIIIVPSRNCCGAEDTAFLVFSGGLLVGKAALVPLLQLLLLIITVALEVLFLAQVSKKFTLKRLDLGLLGHPFISNLSGGPVVLGHTLRLPSTVLNLP